MAAPVYFYSTTGRNLYFLIVRPADNYLWNTSTTDFAAFPTGDMDNYDIQFSEVGTGTGIYSASWPTDADMVTGNYEVIVCEEATPSSRDDGDLKVGGDSVYYNATAQTLEGIQGEWADGGRLDTLLDGASAPTTAEIKTALEADGSKLDHLWEMTEDDGGTRRYTTNALEQASGTGASAAQVWSYATRILTGSSNVTVTSAVTDDLNIEITQYDDYLASTGRALTWSNEDSDWFDGDISGASVTLTITDMDGTEVISKAGSVSAGSGTQAVACDLTSAETALFTSPGRRYKYQLLIVKDTYRETEVTGYVDVTLTNNEPS